MNILPNCVLCGRFVGWRKASLKWKTYDSDEEQFAHADCWKDPSFVSIVKDLKHMVYPKPVKARSI